MSAIPRVAPRIPRNSESCSENGLFARRAFFQNWGGSQVSDFERFWAIASECPKECFLSAFGPFLRPKSTQQALFGALRGNCPKSLKKHSVGHFQARVPGTPVSGGRDCNTKPKNRTNIGERLRGNTIRGNRPERF